MNLEDLASFVRVVDLGTITAAAEFEGVPKSTISRRIQRLESALGVELLRRSARSFTVTQVGQSLYQRSLGALRELVDAEQAILESSNLPRGRLVISAPDLGRSGPFAELFVAYRSRYPEVQIELRLENRVVDLLQEGVDIGIRAHSGAIPGHGTLMSRSYDLPAMGFYASPSYLQKRGVPASPSDLKEHQLVLHRAACGTPIPFVVGEQRLSFSFEEPAFQVDDFLFGQSLVEAGAGVGMLFQFAAKHSEKRGLLQRVLSSWSMRAGRLSLVWPSSRHLSPRIRTFLEVAHEFFESSELHGCSEGQVLSKEGYLIPS